MIMMASLSMIVMAMLLLNQVPSAHFSDMFAVRNLSQCDNGDGDGDDGDGDGDDDAALLLLLPRCCVVSAHIRILYI